MIGSVDSVVSTFRIAAFAGLEPSQLVFGATVVESLFGDETSPRALLLVTSVLLWLGYLSLRISGRLRIPLVTSFLLLGVAVGPSGLGLIARPTVDALGFIEPVALGLITFSAGEQLVLRDVLGLARRNKLGVVLETLLPTTLVAACIFAATGRIELALPLGAIAGTTGIATVVATLKERRAQGSFTRLLSVAIATDNVFAILAFTLILPIAMALEQVGGIGGLYLRSMGGILLSIALGSAAGALLARYIGRIKSSSELSIFVLAHLLLTVALVDILGGSVLLAGLSMGMVGVNLSGGMRERDWLFRSLGPLEDPIIAIFFLWAGAGLHVAALGEVGAIAALYLVARAVGKWLGPRMAAFGSEKGSREAWELKALGFGLFPQAGAAIGLGILARDALPVAGEQILAVVLGTVIVFELTGPLAVSRAVTAAGEATEAPLDQPMTLSEAVHQLEQRKGVLMAVTGPTTSVWQLANTLNLASRLQTDVVLMPTGDAADDRRGGSPAGDGLIEALRSYAESTDQNVSVLPECSGDTVAGILAAAREQQVDLLILAWGPNRSRLARQVVEGAHCPVVELPGTNTRRSVDRVGLGGVVRTFAGAGYEAARGRFFRPRD